MKFLKLLLLAALFPTLTSCATTTTLDGLSGNEHLPYDEATLQGPLWCGTEEIYMTASQYTIRCSDINKIFFMHDYYAQRSSDTLVWFDVSYEDIDTDGWVDQIIVDNRVITVDHGSTGYYIQQTYRKMLRDLQQPRIHRVWKSRWTSR